MSDTKLDVETERAIRWFELSIISGTEPDCARSAANLRNRIRELIAEEVKRQMDDAYGDGSDEVGMIA